MRKVITGGVRGRTGGRADALAVDVPGGAYVIPSDVVGALGHGNTEAGMYRLEKQFGNRRTRRAAGGSVPILISDGEYVVSPEDVERAGGADALDEFVMSARDRYAKHLASIPAPNGAGDHRADGGAVGGLFDDIPMSGEAGLFDDIPMSGPSPAAGSRAAADRDYREPFNDGSGGVGPDYEAIGADKTPLGGFARAVANGALLNYGDEGEAGIRSMLPGSPEYRDILADVRRQRADYAEQYPDAARVGEITGGLGTALVPGLGLLGRAPSVARAMGIGAGLSGLQGAANATGKLEGEHSPAEYAGEAASGAVVPAAIGAGIPAVGNVVARVVGPWATEAARALAARGIHLTPGELVGGGMHRAEDALGSVPFLGNMVRARRREGIDTFNRAEWSEAVPGAVRPETEMGHNAVIDATQHFNREYGRIVPQMTARSDAPYVAELAGIRARLPASIRPAFMDAYDRHVVRNVEAGGLTGRAIQDSLQGLRREATNLRLNPGHAHDIDLADALSDTRTAIEQSAERHSPADITDTYRATNAAYRRFVPLRDASSRLGADAGVAADTSGAGGVFRPSQVLNAVRAADKTVGKGAFARGEAPMQTTAATAKNVMGQEIPDSGTAERLAVGALLGGAGYTGGAPAIAPMLTALGLYSQPGNRAFQALATYSPHTRAAIRRAIERASAAAGPAGAVAGEEYGRADGGRVQIEKRRLDGWYSENAKQRRLRRYA